MINWPFTTSRNLTQWSIQYLRVSFRMHDTDGYEHIIYIWLVLESTWEDRWSTNRWYRMSFCSQVQWNVFCLYKMKWPSPLTLGRMAQMSPYASTCNPYGEVIEEQQSWNIDTHNPSHVEEETSRITRNTQRRIIAKKLTKQHMFKHGDLYYMFISIIVSLSSFPTTCENAGGYTTNSLSCKTLHR